MLSVLVSVAAAVGAPALTEYPEVDRSGDQLVMRAGRTVKVTVRVPIVGPPSAYGQVLVRSAGWTGIADVLPAGEIIRTVQSAGAVDVAVLLSANARASRGKKGVLRVVINDPDIGRPVGEVKWRPTLVIQASGRPIDVERAASELGSAREDLNFAVARLGPIADRVRRQGSVVLGPDSVQWRDPLQKVVRAQGQIQALAAELRAVALADPGPDGDRAAQAVARHAGSPQQPSRRAVEKLGAQKGLERASALLIRLQIEQALGWVDALIDGQTLNRSELARAYVLQGTVQALAGIDVGAKAAFDKASCLDPVARPPDRPLFESLFSRLSRPPACAQPLNALGATVVRSSKGGGIVLNVVVRYGPDPFSLVAGGTVQLFDAQGGLVSQQPAASEMIEGAPALVAEFIDDGSITDATGRVMIAATLEGPGRVVLADFGSPEPEVVEVEDAGLLSGVKIPLWLWVTLGVVAVGGAAAAIAAATSGGDELDSPRGIGPINIQF